MTPVANKWRHGAEHVRSSHPCFITSCIERSIDRSQSIEINACGHPRCSHVHCSLSRYLAVIVAKAAPLDCCAIVIGLPCILILDVGLKEPIVVKRPMQVTSGDFPRPDCKKWRRVFGVLSGETKYRIGPCQSQKGLTRHRVMVLKKL